MILSILISVYNFDCRLLLENLLQQLPCNCEIVVADDASTDIDTHLRNKTFAEKETNIRYWESPNNLGRARIRNRLAQLAQGEWLLFLDCDAIPSHNNFLNSYLNATDNADVVCGGTKVLPNCPSPNVRLRYNYEKKFWKNSSIQKRSQKPYESFTTFNFMIRKSVFESILFCNNCVKYGHEDTLFGIELSKKKIRIKHIDNAAIHTGLDDNAEFLKKTETAIESLVRIDPQMIFPLGINRAYLLLQRWHLLTIFRIWHIILSPIERRNLISHNPSLFLFQLYKLGVYCQLRKVAGF